MASHILFQKQESTKAAISAPSSSSLTPRPFAQPAEMLEVASKPQSVASAPVEFSVFAPDCGSPPLLQPKLTIGALSDKYEQNVDRVAKEVVQRLSFDGGRSATGLTKPIQPNLTLQRETLPDNEDALQIETLANQPQQVELTGEEDVILDAELVAKLEALYSALKQFSGPEAKAENEEEQVEIASGYGLGKTELVIQRKPDQQNLIQCARHNQNYRKRVKELVKPQKGALTGVHKTNYAKAKRLADKLDANDPAKLKYVQHYKKATGTTHPVWQVLSQAKKMYQILDSLGASQEIVRWFQQVDPVTNRVLRRGMRARLKPGALMKGSDTTGTNALYYGTPVLEKRKNSSVKPSALYIKGHLLNDHMGGAGISHNLVPLTAEKKATNNKTGSNDANGIHNYEIEEPLKLLLSGTQPITTDLHYRVDSLPPKGPRLQTAIVKKFAADFSSAAQNPANAGKKNVQLYTEIETADPRLAGVGSKLISAVKGSSMKPSNLAPVLKENADLWETEDQMIPAGIECTAYYDDPTTGKRVIPKAANGKPIYKFKIENKLPSLYTAPFKR